jgi:cation diffusion facilitator family transporter
MHKAKTNFEQNLGYIEGWISVVLNTALFVVKYWVGMKYGSVSMIADAWHTLSDTLTSLVVIVGFWIAARPADQEHPFGHGRAEAIAAIIIGTLLAVVGFNFLSESITRLRHHQAARFGMLCIVVFSISVVLKEALAQFSFWAGRRINSRALAADGWHHRSDAVASALIVAGALLGSYFWWIDGAMGIGVALLILYATYDILKGAAGILLGERGDAALEKEIMDVIIRTAPATSDVHHLHLHTYGDHRELTMHLRLPANMELQAAHAIAHDIEEAIRRDMDIETTVHVDPADSAVD